MRVLVIGGMHGNEPLGLQVVALFRANFVDDVDVVIANQRAVAKNCRFLKNDLNRSFPGNAVSKDYETKRAAELIALARKYDVVLDFHNTHCPDNDCSFVGEQAKTQLVDVAAWFGLSRIIVANYDCVNKYADNCLSIEISLSSKRMDAEWWYERISRLVKVKEVPIASGVEKYSFVYRMTLGDRDKLQLSSKKLKAFKPIGSELANQMKVASPAYPIFVGDNYTPYNYGGLLNRLN